MGGGREGARKGGWSLKEFKEADGGLEEVWASEWVWACLYVCGAVCSVWADGRVCIVLSAEWNIHVSCGFTVKRSLKVQYKYLILYIFILTL